MGTRGAIGVTLNGKNYITYNHFDSYPDGLGIDTLAEVPEILNLKNKVLGLKLIQDDDAPTQEDIENLAAFTNLNVSEQSTEDWYCLLRNAQGSLLNYLKAGYMPDNESFMQDSLFCEWAYIVNFDTNKLECYQGFQKSKPVGRFANDEPDSSGYYAVTLIAEFDLDNLPSEEDFLSELQEEDEE